MTAQANPVNAQTEVQTHTLLAFYTIYLNPTLSLSLSGGPQYFRHHSISLATVSLVDAFCDGKHWLAKESYQFCSQLLTNRYGKHRLVWSLQFK